MPDDKTRCHKTFDEMQHFLQSAVHDLRAAQRRTGISAELLLDSDAGQRNELVAQILQGLSKSEELLLGISKYAIALTPNNYSIVEFPAMTAVRFAMANLDSEIRKTGASVIAADLPEIRADRDRIADLFEQLIANSIKFRGADPPVVEIAVHEIRDGWRFSVRDNGIGIASKYRSRLFVAFQRLQGADVPGAGLGLAIARKIVEAHGGSIWMEEDGADTGGITVSFTLPGIDGA